MNPPKIDICIEGYNTEQTDFYISHLINKINLTTGLYEKALNKISFLENENEKLRNNLIDLSKKLGNNTLDIEILNQLKQIKSVLGIEIAKESDDKNTSETDAEKLSFEEKLKDLRNLLNS